MFAYTAIVWEPKLFPSRAVPEPILRQIAKSPTARVAYDAPGMRVYCQGERRGSSEIHKLQSNAGVILGTIFTRTNVQHGESEKATLGPEETRTIVASRGKELIDSYWGRYVAFLHAPDGQSLIVRSPASEIDCLHTRMHGVSVFFSSAQHCPLLDLRSFDIDWDYVAADICTLMSATQRTGLKGIERIAGGECITVSGDKAVRGAYWQPLRLIRERSLEDPMHAAELLRNTTRACVNAWASCYDSVLAMVSGGLDSSIVGSLMHKAPRPPAIICLNNRNPFDPMSDERQYARPVAEHMGCALIERNQDADFSIEPLLDLPRRISPWSNLLAIGEAQRFRPAVNREHRIQAYFSGHGGDQIFFTGAADYMCADFIQRHWMHPKVLSVALDAARISHSALWPALRQGLRDALVRDPLQPTLALHQFSQLLHPEVADAVRAQRLFVPHWFDDDLHGIPPGKCWQLISLSSEEILNDPWDLEDGPEIVNPLLAQPLQELCLQIPSYVLTHGGRDRGLARLAFRDDVPNAILRRRDKGAISAYFKAVWMANLPFVRSLVLDGRLVRQGLVDRVKLEKVLSGDFSKGLGFAADIISIVGTEAWLQHWAGHQAAIAA